MVRPNLCHPAIRRQYLILLVLRTKNRQHLSVENHGVRKIYLDDERAIEYTRDKSAKVITPRCAAPSLPFVLGIPD